MATDWTSKPYHVNTVVWAPFDRIEGAASNIDAVISACGSANVKYSGGELLVANQVAGEDFYVGKDSNNVPIRLYPTVIQDGYTED